MASEKSLTKNQSQVMNALSQAKGPLSAYALLDQLRDQGFKAPLQVYRALEKLVDYGMVHRLESLNSFVACAHPHHHSHGLIAFAICENCGHTDEFTDSKLEQTLGGWASANNFKVEKTTIELRGQCGRCLAAH
ncbi:transcriptional repressor [Aureimonas fodinaquatilis]|uniref:Ferric uptake regulation protein n=1 Tax=Aureimonas fodinaquatilis TaxID=2565783 RepID=A0A5B0DYM0_9HYPH|nr:Fur family transcriptional regulator [Aureimonas fodinaquatilis]KAA0970650.1 transcriptional repressor [Aureimonas fodinaquatilis]